MTEMARLKLLLDIPEGDKVKDEVLSLLIDQAKSYLKSYCRVNTVTEEMIPAVISMAAEDFGRIGGEGVSYRSASGASESYRGEYSPRIMMQLRSWRRIGGPRC